MDEYDAAVLRIGRVVGIVGAMALTVACGNDRSSAPSETAEPATPPPAPVASGLAPELLPDILIVVLDTTSPLAIASAMPNAAAFEAESRHFSRAVSPSNTTMEAVAGMMTGTWMSSARLWDEGFVTLSEALRDVGY